MAEISKEEQWKAFMVAGTPGEQHRLLGRFVGTWDTVGRMWMEGPDGPVSESRGVVETRWLIPGLWIMDEVKTEMMGRPFEGFSISGYDNVKRKYVGMWVDAMSTALLTMEGNFDREGKTLALFGTADDPATGEHDKLMGYVTRVVDDDHHVFEIWDYSARPEGTITMELEYARRK